jgi:hypothetical protein
MMEIAVTDDRRPILATATKGTVARSKLKGFGGATYGEFTMSEKSPDTKTMRLVLTDQRSDIGRIAVDMEAFFEFSFELAEELEDLVQQWSHMAPPRSTRKRSDIRGI